jgi:hypothetical protein
MRIIKSCYDSYLLMVEHVVMLYHYMALLD